MFNTIISTLFIMGSIALVVLTVCYERRYWERKTKPQTELKSTSFDLHVEQALGLVNKK